MTSQVLRLRFPLEPLIAKAKRRARQRRAFVALGVTLLAAAVAGMTLALRSKTPASGPTGLFTREASSAVPMLDPGDCGSGFFGPGFRVYACMSGGAAAGHPHPQELVVVRKNGSSLVYPDYRGGDFAGLGGEVVAIFDASLVRVTSSRLVPLVTESELAASLHIQPRELVGIYALGVDAHGDVSFRASILPGCRNLLLERTPAGTIRQLRTLRDQVCH